MFSKIVSTDPFEWLKFQCEEFGGDFTESVAELKSKVRDDCGDIVFDKFMESVVRMAETTESKKNKAAKTH